MNLNHLTRVLPISLIILLVACTTPPPPPPTPAAVAPTEAPPTATPAPPPTATPAPAAPTAAIVPPSPTPAPQLAGFFDDQRLNYEPGFYALEIQAFLDSHPGELKDVTLTVGDRRHTFAEVLAGQTAYYGINPKIILALMELQSRLISDSQPTADQFGWAAGFRGENGRRRGLQAQVRWAVKEMLYARRDYPQRAPIIYADGSPSQSVEGMTLAEYSIGRVLAASTTPGNLPGLMDRFLATYTRLFDDPRIAPADWPPPAEPFLTRPIGKMVPITSFFDHGGPFLTRNGAAGIATYWGRVETDPIFAYNGHDGWDYAAAPPERALAAADGIVAFAGNADDGCATRAVVLDHGNGYRTLYWHLDRVDVAIGALVARGEPIGVIGNTGCSTGPHLHFGVQYLGRNTDPYGWCGAGVDPWAAHPAGAASIWLWADRPSPCDPPPPGAVVVDAGMPGFLTDGDNWRTAPSGRGGEALFTPSVRGAGGRAWELRPLTSPSLALWRPELPATGAYRVIAYIPYALSGFGDATALRYLVRHSGGMTEVVVNASVHANDWAELGTYTFDPAGAEVVLTGAAESGLLSVWADAVMWLPASQ